MPGTMLDLPDALRDAGLRVWVAPDWRTNGHGIDVLDRPYGGVLHHTAGYGLRSVYGLPDARPDVPQPRANIWTPRPGTQPYDVALTSAGRAWQAGTNNSRAHADLRAGRFSVRTADAVDRFGRDSDDLDGGTTSAKTIGNEVESLGTVGIAYPDEQLDVIAITMRVCVDVFDWPGLGCWAHHRQLTWRKPDMSYRGDIWSRAAAISIGPIQEDEDMPSIKDLNAAAKAGQLDDFFTREAQVLARYGIARGVDVRASVASLLDDEPRLASLLAGGTEKVLGRLEALPSAELSDDDVERIAVVLAARLAGAATPATQLVGSVKAALRTPSPLDAAAGAGA